MTFVRFIADLVFVTWALEYGTARTIFLFNPAAKAIYTLGAVHQILLPFAAPCLVFRLADNLAHPEPANFYTTPGGVLWLVLMWLSRNWPDDDKWKRLRRKAKAAVKRIGVRLVVVPREA